MYQILATSARCGALLKTSETASSERLCPSLMALLLPPGARGSFPSALACHAAAIGGAACICGLDRGIAAAVSRRHGRGERVEGGRKYCLTGGLNLSRGISAQRRVALATYREDILQDQQQGVTAGIDSRERSVALASPSPPAPGRARPC